MSDHTRILCNALWIAHPVLQTVIAIVMFRRSQHRAFKYFFAYIVVQILAFAVVFPAYLYNSVAFFTFPGLPLQSALCWFQGHSRSLPRCVSPFHTLRDLAPYCSTGGLVMLLVAGVVSVSANSSDTAPWVEAS